jgi:MinD superfamily P-loop ATPase
MIIAVASGKGGTGKTTVALGIAYYLNKAGKCVTLLDCDVEEPNINLFLKSEIKCMETVNRAIPDVVKDLCNSCGKCEEICLFNCIFVTNDGPLIFPEMCHSCGGCRLVCPPGAITEIQREIGVIEEGCMENIRYFGGRLNVSEAISPPLIEAVKKHISENDINIIDSPPGTSCPVIKSVKGSDYVVMVTEPTPFGLNDLKIGIEMLKELGLPCGVVINRSDIGDSRVIDYCREQNIKILAQIPNSIELARRYSSGDFMDFFINKFSGAIDDILSGAGLNFYAGVK